MEDKEAKEVFLSMSKDVGTLIYTNFVKVYKEASEDFTMIDILTSALENSVHELKAVKEGFGGMHVECSTIQ